MAGMTTLFAFMRIDCQLYYHLEKINWICI
nr:MAG TPA: hypothetical protein [Caudoviricetes sp.]